MVLENFYKLRERINSLLTQGLRIVSPEELEALAQELSALNLEQPAALLKQIRQSVANGIVEKKDLESLIKVLQVLSQAETQMSEVGALDIKNITEAQGSCFVYVNPAEIQQTEQQDLSEIINIPNTFVRGHRVVEYFKKTGYEELVKSIKIAWFDYSLSNFICSGLQERPEEALKLAQTALNHKNQVIKRTAIKVLERIGTETSRRQEVSDILAERFKKPKQAMKYIVEETIAKIEGRYEEYLVKKRKNYKYTERNIKLLASSKKSERYAGIYGLTATDPYFTDVLARALEREDDKKNIKFLLRRMVEIGGFDAISTAVWFFEGAYARQALEAVSKFGDRCVLTFLFNRIKTNLPASYYRYFLPLYGDLAIEPLLYTLKTMENPEAYKGVFSTIFTALSSDALNRRIIESIESDAEFAEKFASLMQKMYPKLFKKAGAKKKVKKPSVTDIKQVMLLTLGGTKIERQHVSGMLLAPDGKYLIILARGKGVDILSTDTWKQKASLNVEGYPLLIALSPDGKFLLTAKWVVNRRTYVIEAWEFGKWEEHIGSITHPAAVNSLAVTSGGKHLLIGSENTIRVVEFGTWREVTELTGYDWRVSYIQPIPGQKVIMTGDWRGWLQVWDETTWNQIARFKSDSWDPRFAELSSEGTLLVYAGHIGIKVWETESWREIISVSKPKGFDYMTLTPDTKYLVVAKTKKLRFLEFSSWKEILTLDNNENISSILVTPDGKNVITFGGRGIKVWNIDLSMFY